MRNRTTNRAQREPKVFSGSLAAMCAIRAWWPLRPGRSTKLTIFWPAKPSTAGIRVSEIIRAMNTEPAAARPITVRKGMPTTDSPHSAMMTVSPANTTELPAVPTARGTESSGSIPLSRLLRCRDRMNSP